MFQVIFDVAGTRRSKRFDGTPEAMNCAAVLLAKYGIGEVTISVEDTNGRLIFAHDDILHACAQVKA